MPSLLTELTEEIHRERVHAQRVESGDNVNARRSALVGRRNFGDDKMKRAIEALSALVSSPPAPAPGNKL